MMNANYKMSPFCCKIEKEKNKRKSTKQKMKQVNPPKKPTKPQTNKQKNPNKNPKPKQKTQTHQIACINLQRKWNNGMIQL